MVANSIALDQKRADRIETIWEKLNGNFDAEKYLESIGETEQPPSKEQQQKDKERMKMIFGVT